MPSLCRWIFLLSLTIAGSAPGAAEGATVTVIDHPDLVDDARGGRPVPLMVWVPDGPGPFPVVVLSHGGGGSRESFRDLANPLARRGYVVICPQHAYSDRVAARELFEESLRRILTGRRQRLRDLPAEERKAVTAEAFLDALHRMTKNPKAMLERPGDVSFALDRATEWNRQEGRLKGRLDLEAIAVGGHSFGAYTTLVVCGARPVLDHLDPPVAPGHGLAPDASDPRVRIGIAMSPQSPRGVYFGEESYATIDRPLLCLSGSKDTEKGRQGELLPGEGRKEAFRLMPPGDKHLVWLDGADHMSFTFYESPDLPLTPSPALRDTQRITSALVFSFCDLHLKRSEAARGVFNVAHAHSLCGAEVTKVEWWSK